MPGQGLSISPFVRHGVVGGGIPPIITDGNTVSWLLNDLTTITKDGSDRMARWNDYLGSGHDVIQGGADALKPIWSVEGATLDGDDDFMKSVGFTFNQPEFIYMAIKPLAWGNDDYFIDGDASFSGLVAQSGSTPNIVGYAGSISSEEPNLILNQWGIVRILFNGVSSKLIVNDNTPVTGDFGAANMGGLTLGKAGLGSSNWANYVMGELIARKISDTAGDEADIYNYLYNKFVA